jgi:hypothetical protein
VGRCRLDSGRFMLLDLLYFKGSKGLVMAEREGFEPPIPVKVCLISSQVHSTALPSLRMFIINELGCSVKAAFVHCVLNCVLVP